MTARTEKRVVLGYSGGVDSTAACLLLQEQGYEVYGLCFDVFGEAGGEARAKAENRAKELGISLKWVDASKRFKDAVIDDFCRSYREGKTPNPCVICNPLVKFRLLIEYADELGIGPIATGHYARVTRVTNGIPEKAEEESGGTGADGCFAVRRAACEAKDQSYMLYRLEQPVLSRLLLPLGEAPDKEWVRSYVHAHGISNFAEKDSQDICFLPEGVSYADYLQQQGICCDAGIFCDPSGDVLAPSKGYLHYTIGQRKGFGIGFGRPLFVTKIDADANRVYLGDEEQLFTREAAAEQCVFTLADWETEKYFSKPFKCKAKIRYRAKPADSTVRLKRIGETLTADVVFDEPQRALTPGQSIVFYQGDTVIGGGILTQTPASIPTVL